LHGTAGPPIEVPVKYAFPGAQEVMTVSDVIQLLGRPTCIFASVQNEGSDSSSDRWGFYYDVGEYDITFVSRTFDEGRLEAVTWNEDIEHVFVEDGWP